MTNQNGADAAPPQAAPSPAEQELIQRKRLAELQRDIAQLDQERRAADTPAAASTALAGETAMGETAGRAAELVAYQAMRRCADEVAGAINTAQRLPADSRILLVDDLSAVAGDYQLIQLDLQLDLFAQAFGEMKLTFDQAVPQGPAAFSVTATLAGASAVAGLMADVAAYFRSDYTVQGRDVTLSDEALAAFVAGRITRCPVRLAEVGLAAGGDLLAKLRERYEARFRLERTSERLAGLLAELEAAAAKGQAQLAQLRAELVPLAPADEAGRQAREGRIKRLEETLGAQAGDAERIRGARAEWAALSKAFDAFLEATLKPGDGEQRPPLLAALLREQVRRHGITHLLALKVVSGGADVITRKGLFWSGRVAYLGGCAVAYTLTDTEGLVVASDTRSAIVRLDYRLGSGEGALKPLAGLP